MRALSHALRLTLFLGCWTWLGAAGQAEEFAPDSAFEAIFNGVSLENWEGDPTYWRVEDGTLVGEITPQTLLKRNSFIVWRGGVVGDFELKADYLISEKGNSGINYRSFDLEGLPYSMRGYQADIDGGDRWTANNYEERGRSFIAMRGQKTIVDPGERPRVVMQFADAEELQKQLVKKDDWNSFHIVVKGDHHRVYLNGVLVNEAWDRDEKNGPRTGLLGVQVHIGPPMTVKYRNIRLAQLSNANDVPTPFPDYVISESAYEGLSRFDTMESLKFMQGQIDRLTAAALDAPLEGRETLTVKSRLHLVRSDLIGGKVGEPARTFDAVLFDGETAVRVPDVAQKHQDLGFDDVLEWSLAWDAKEKAYRITGVK